MAPGRSSSRRRSCRGAAIGVVWVYIFDPRYGLMNQVLDWLASPTPTLAARSNGHGRGDHRLHLEEPGLRDGNLPGRPADRSPKISTRRRRSTAAGSLNRFWNVTMPMLSPIIFFLLVTSILNTFQSFDII